LGLPFVLALTAAVLTVFVIKRYSLLFLRQFGNIVREGFYVDLFLTNIVVNVFKSISKIFEVVERFLTNSNIIKNIAFSGVKLSAFIEKYIFEYPIRILVQCIKFASKEFELVQVKNSQTYVAYGALIIGVIFTTILLTYSLIIYIRGGMG
jgi:hypothetical protein